MNTESNIHEIPEWNMTRFRKEINKLNKRAVKIGAAPVEVIEKGMKLVIHPEHRPLVEKGKLSFEDAPKVRVHQVEIKGKPPKMEGYAFVGTLDHITLPGKVVVKTVPGQSIPQEFYNNEPRCEQCNKIRRRNDTFVLHHLEDGKHVQVGRNCLRDFFGHDPRQIANFLSSLWRLVESFEDEEKWYSGGSGHHDYYYPHMKVLETTAATIRTFGWVPRSSANPDEGRIATADIVLRIMLPAFDKYSKAEQKDLIRDLKWDKEKDTEEAENAMEWLSNQGDKVYKNEYLHNLNAIMESDAVPSRMFGFWCSLIAAYQKYLDRLVLNSAIKRLNEWVGEVKERREFTVKVVSLMYLQGGYGTVTLHKMLDEDGRNIIWFANTDSGMDVDCTYKVKGTVKKHEEYNDWKQTVLSRVTVIEKVEKDG